MTEDPAAGMNADDEETEEKYAENWLTPGGGAPEEPPLEACFDEARCAGAPYGEAREARDADDLIGRG